MKDIFWNVVQNIPMQGNPSSNLELDLDSLLKSGVTRLKRSATDPIAVICHEAVHR